MRRTSGFTLMEILIVVAIIGILSAIAVPAYSNYVKRAKIVEATSGLSDMAVKMEQLFQDTRSYATGCTAGTVAPTPASTKNFSFACSNLAGTTYTVTATGIGSMVGWVYSIDQTNTRLTVNVGTGWTGTGSTCWVTKQDGSC